ncbi:integrase catalytic domain-containing protein [Nephila pilipes]|uniref:Integrase catalytic domain-containing protein n=1 Tax=Nephila pilipes TaxID=299642 RepID=A0A8X6TV08_NEPPI|nr:integrase catalytic domain-containing protein [Nephila pilipes]
MFVSRTFNVVVDYKCLPFGPVIEPLRRCGRLKKTPLEVNELGNNEGKIYSARTLLDNGSRIHFCSSKMAERLQLQKENVNLNVDVFEILDSCMYVDDLMTGASDTREALKLSRGAKEITSKASMNLRKWVTNDRNLVKEFQKENYDIHPILNDSNVTKLKVLGIQWDFQDDILSVETAWVTEFLKRKKNAKRFILQTAGKM